ncbi:hypothetical protein EIN_373340 [Entamoeba invadens IP1]|uniref:Uncharacterized protein n=1 Tax=Entamoeba invadens IP1 TaxID=370355 RepID=A0A0A1TU28_ENTIV|nr:hypothetical protein EIN_373340 [Entamoeba invadens IP1]ELP83389.1 hypothetical protein EIN_373340 [Entamoeba invadens IP1]|eukprot:XP_004182735.1 hypothetical protein EIN_373340 [Entamoeba invadens IP1]
MTTSRVNEKTKYLDENDGVLSAKSQQPSLTVIGQATRRCFADETPLINRSVFIPKSRRDVIEDVPYVDCTDYEQESEVGPFPDVEKLLEATCVFELSPPMSPPFSDDEMSTSPDVTISLL